jgi:hypothetical protein
MLINKKANTRVKQCWLNGLAIVLSFPNTGGSTFSDTTFSTIFHSQLALEKMARRNLFISLFKPFNAELSSKMLKNIYTE